MRQTGERGNEPVNLLTLTLKKLKFVSPLSEGSVPVRLFWLRLMPVTVLPTLSQVTPNHVHSVPAEPVQLVRVIQVPSLCWCKG